MPDRPRFRRPRSRTALIVVLACWPVLVSCDSLVADRVPHVPPGDPPSPEADSVACDCQELGLQLGSPDMPIAAGQAAIPLPPRAQRIEIHSAPATLSQTDTEYVLMQDVSAPQTAFEITVNNITLNLNGHTITYGTADSPQAAYPNGTAGVKRLWGLTGIVIANGEIVQGGGACQGDISGRNCNPVMGAGGRGTFEVGGLRLSYRSPDTSGIIGGTAIHHNTLVDSGTHVTYAGTGVPAISSMPGAYVHHNKILSARHRGVVIGNDCEVAYNEIHINSYTVNSFGIMLYHTERFSVHHNKIYGSGVHPIGIHIASQGIDGQVFSNYVITENSRTDTAATTGSAAFRITTYGGWCDRIEVNCNYFVSKGGNEHPELVGKSWGRALWIGGLQPGNAVDIHHNYVEAITSDEAIYHSAIAVVSQGYNDGLLVRDNTVVANHTMVALTDGYGNGGAGYPKFIRNRFIRKGTYPTYRTIADKLYEYWDVTGLFLDNTYENGAELSAATLQLLQVCTNNKTDIGIGHTVNGQPVIEYWLTDDQTRTANATAWEAFGNCGYKVTP